MRLPPPVVAGAIVAGLLAAAPSAAGAATLRPGSSAAPGSTAVAARAAAAAKGLTSGPTGIQARNGELAEPGARRLLWVRRRDVPRPMGSITKVMTALVVIRAGHLARKITITGAEVRYVREHDASSAGLQPGDVLTARQLLEAMLVPSGCDAAYALAMAYGPGWKSFVRKMNAMARHLGLTGTHFANFDGLPWPTATATHSTARDLVILGETAMKSALFRELVRQRSYSIPATAQTHRYHWQTTNQLLGSFRGAIGIKTGTTGAAGYCLLFEAQRGSESLIGVVLDSGKTDGARFTAARRLLNWGFSVLRRRAGTPARAG
ncbi:MAG: D-alanyl-D-alanine carboxypeptidase family protein [Streptosporangiaceae bacterium]|jgi:D-alanyl-D-alanine carboxypeptidase (penicillin-binding protein 5/6)